MKFICIGINHTLMDMDQRKNFYFRDSDKLSFSTHLLDIVDQIVILSTCNRSEVYVMADDSFDEEQLKAAYFSYFHQENDCVFLETQDKAINHLLEVACGLSSMVVGEDQILHQIKEAMAWSMKQHFSGKELNYIFQTVIKFAKEMRNTYAISEHPLSVSYIGYQYIKEVLKDNDKVMICGIGEMSQLMIEYLKDYELYIVNRTYDKVIPYLNEKRHYVSFDERYNYIDRVNVVVSATASPHIVFEADKLDPNQEIVFLDLAMPRDVDIHIKQSKNKRLVDMDDLRCISEAHLQKRLEICDMIKKECVKQTALMLEELQVMKSDDIIYRMQQRYLNLSNETYELLIHKLDLSSKEQYILKKVLKSSFLRLMKDPIQLLKSKDIEKQEQYIELVTQLFNLKENDE